LNSRLFLQTKPSAALALIAGASGLIYALVFTWPFALPRLYATIPPVDYAKLTGHSPGGLAAYVLGIGGLFGLYLIAIQIGRQMPRPSLRFIMMTSTLLAAISIPAYPLTAIDLFIYAIRTRGLALYGLNPLATAPDQLPPTDPWLGLAGEWLDAASPYGPVWEWLSLGSFHLSGGDYLSHLLALKAVAALAYLGSIWLVWLILQRSRPAWAVAGTLAFAWNPLVLLESVQNGHNDILMTFFLLAAMVSSQKTEHRNQMSEISWAMLTVLLLSLSILVKFVTAAAVPFFLLALTANEAGWPRRLLKMGLYGLIIAGLVVGLMWPLWPGLEAWAVLQAGSGAGRSLLALLVLGLREVVSLNTAFGLARNAINFTFGLIYLYFLSRAVFNKRKSLLETIAAPVFYILFWYVLLAAPVFHAWYLLWFVPLASLVNHKAFPATIVFSITALLVIPYFETMRVWYPALLENHLLGHLIGVPLLILPPALTVIWPISPKQHFEVS